MTVTGTVLQPLLQARIKDAVNTANLLQFYQARLLYYICICPLRCFTGITKYFSSNTVDKTRQFRVNIFKNKFEIIFRTMAGFCR